MATYYSQGSDVWSTLTNWDTNAGGGGSDPASVADMDDDTFVIQAGHDILMDADMSGFANGIAGLTIQGHATTPAKLYWANGSDGILKLKTGASLIGTSGTASGQLVANSDGAYATTTALAAANTAHILLAGTATILTQYLDCNMRSNEPTTTSVRTYGQIFHECTVDAGANTLTYTGIAAALPNTRLVRVSAGSGALPAELSANTDYWIVGASGNTVQLSLTSGGAAIDLSAGGPINLHCGWYANWGVSGNTLTKTTHGLANGTAVMVQSTGTLPTPLAADTMYYVVSTAANAISLATVSGGTALTLGGSPTGTLNIYSGSTGAAPGLGGTNPYTSTMVNVLDDVTGESTTWVPTASSTWTATLGLSAAVLVDAGQVDVDQQRLAIVSATASTMTLSVVVDSVQYPNARIWLASRNVEIQSSDSSDVSIVNGTSNTTGGVFGGIRGTSATQSARGINAGTSCSATTISGCTSGIRGCTSCSATTISGCTSGIYAGTSCTATTISGCTYGIHTGTSCTATTISGCTYGIYTGTSCTATTISGCTSGIYAGTSCTATTISGCSQGIYIANGSFRETVFSGNTYDVRRPRGVVGYGVAMQSGTQVYEYLHSAASVTDTNCGVSMYDFKNGSGSVQPGYIGRWDVGGYTKSTAFVEGTPAITPPTCIHVTTCQDNDVSHIVEIPLWCAVDQAMTVTVYGKQVSTGFDARAKWELIDPSVKDGDGDEVLDTVTITDNTYWQTLALSAPARTEEGPIWLRLTVRGGTAAGTGGDDVLYWFQVAELDYPLEEDVENAVSYANGVYEGTLAAGGGGGYVPVSGGGIQGVYRR